MDHTVKINRRQQDKSWPNALPTPAGAGDQQNLTTMLIHVLFDVKDEHGRTGGEILVEKLVELAREGNFKAIQEIFQRIDGNSKYRQEAASMPLMSELVQLKADEMLEVFYDEVIKIRCDRQGPAISADDAGTSVALGGAVHGSEDRQEVGLPGT